MTDNPTNAELAPEFVTYIGDSMGDFIFTHAIFAGLDLPDNAKTRKGVRHVSLAALYWLNTAAEQAGATDEMEAVLNKIHAHAKDAR